MTRRRLQWSDRKVYPDGDCVPRDMRVISLYDRTCFRLFHWRVVISLCYFIVSGYLIIDLMA